MSTMQTGVQNGFLRSLAVDDLALLRPHLAARDAAIHHSIFEPNAPLEHVYFPETGLVSLVTPGEDPVEVGVIGREGVVGAHIVLGTDRAALRAFAQIAGHGHATPTAVIQRMFGQSATLRDSFSRYAYIMLLQTADAAQANGNFTVEQRLARWLLMCQDRVGDEIVLTHDFMAVMLGCRRPGVTVATHVLEGLGLVRAKRGLIVVRNREGLIDFADGSYGLIEAEYDRLFGRSRIEA